MKKRILQFIDSFHQGGSERQAVALTRMLKNEGSYEIFLATLNDEGVLRSAINALGLPEIPEFRLTSFFNINAAAQARRCAKYLRENKIALIHTHDFYTNIFGMAAASMAGISAKVASKRETGGMRSVGQEFVERMAFNRANAVVVNSTAVQKHIATLGIPENKSKLIYNGLDIDRFVVDRDPLDVKQSFGLPVNGDIRFIALVANLRHAVKNVPMVLRAAKRVIADEPNAHFVIAGEGELAAQLAALASELDIDDNVHFIGRCDDVPELLSVSYAGVLTSTAEGFANSILEYMAAGKPVVATNVGGAGEAIGDGETGYLVGSNDDAAMAGRLIELLNDKQKASKFGTAGKQIVTSKFSEETQLRETLTLYNSLLS